MKCRNILCILLAVVLVLGMSGSGLVLALDNISAGTIGGIVEEKIYSNATLEDDFADDRVLVVLNNAASLKLKTYTAADFPEIQCASVNDLSTATKARVTAKLKGEDVASVCAAPSDNIVFSDFYEVDVQEYNQILCLTLPTAGKQNVLAAMKLLMQREDVKYAGPDYVIRPFWTTPDDTEYSRQWAANNILLPMAWDINTGSSSVIVGVIDSGIHASHPDLSGKVVVGLSRECTAGQAVAIPSVADPYGHGTMVAGIIAAKGDNGSGICGVGWSVRLASLRVFTYDSERGYYYGYSSYALAAINYATTAGIPILNLSGGWVPGITNQYGNMWYDVPLYDAIEDYPGLFVCAAGNEVRDLDHFLELYPAEFDLPNLISVGASTQNDTLWMNEDLSEGTNTGYNGVDIFAPGENIISTSRTGGYATATGTSLAAPFVAGVAALMLSECETLTAAQVRTIIINYDDNISAFDGKCESGGRLNAYKALNYVRNHYNSTSNNTVDSQSCLDGEMNEVANTNEQFIGLVNSNTTIDPRKE